MYSIDIFKTSEPGGLFTGCLLERIVCCGYDDLLPARMSIRETCSLRVYFSSVSLVSVLCRYEGLSENVLRNGSPRGVTCPVRVSNYYWRGPKGGHDRNWLFLGRNDGTRIRTTLPVKMSALKEIRHKKVGK